MSAQTDMDDETPETVMRAYVDSHAPTPPLDDFLLAYKDDDNWWWRTQCGHHQNLFDAAMERVDELEHRLKRARAQHGPADFQPNVCITCMTTMPCPTIIALENPL